MGGRSALYGEDEGTETAGWTIWCRAEQGGLDV